MLLDYFAKKRFVIIFVIVVVASIFLGVSIAVLNTKNYYKGIKVDSVDISGISMEQASMLMDKRISEVYSKKIYFTYKDRKWLVEPCDIGLSFNKDKTLKEAYKIGRVGNRFNRMLSVFSLKFNDKNIPIEATYDKVEAKKVLNSIKSQVDNESKNATVLYQNGEVLVNKETTGLLLDIDENIKVLENSINNRRFDKISLKVKEVTPKVLFKDIGEINSELASFNTSFSLGDINRSQNIQLACSRMNGTVIFKNEMFSMNNSIGPRTAKNGYKEANVILKNELVKGTGGGVCQVTTTLYNAILLAKLQVVERTHHSMTLGYVEPGLDATIAENYIDFKFKNNKNYPICITSEVKDNLINIKILGRKESDSYVVRLRPNIIKEYLPQDEEIIEDFSIPIGERIIVQEAKNGVEVGVFRDTFTKDGKLIQSEKISDDIYSPIRAKVKLNRGINILNEFIEKEG